MNKTLSRLIQVKTHFVRNLHKKMSLELNLIAACDSKNGIGKDNSLPWRLRNEMAYFARMTTGNSNSPAEKNVVVMGRKTWDSTPPKFRPLKNRLNVVLSRSNPPDGINHPDLIWTTDWDKMLELLKSRQEVGNLGKIWIIGGSYIYKLALESPHCHRIYLTRIEEDFGCDVFFPKFDLDAYKLVKDTEVPEGEQEEGGVKYNYFVYEKVQ